jgi:hypothetical protein
MKKLSVVPIGMLALMVTLQGATAVEEEDLNLYTVRDLYDTCSVAADSADYVPAVLACRAFIGATVQYHDAVSDQEHMKRLVCYPKGATVDEGRNIFVSWAKRRLDQEARMGEAAVVGVVRALADRYPCR